MKFGIHLPQFGRAAGPDTIRRAAMEAEQQGYDDIWVSDHLAIPVDAPYPPTAYIYEPLVSLTWAAAATTRVGLGTSVLVLPMRHPLVLAKMLATLDLMSGGRVTVGAAVGWLEAEFDALGVPFNERGARSDETIRMLRACWTEDPVNLKGKRVPADFKAMRTLPHPRHAIPIWVGGKSDAALDRAVRLGDGWHGSHTTPEDVAPTIAAPAQGAARGELRPLAPPALGRAGRRRRHDAPPCRRVPRPRHPAPDVPAAPAPRRGLAALGGEAAGERQEGVRSWRAASLMLRQTQHEAFFAAGTLLASS